MCLWGGQVSFKSLLTLKKKIATKTTLPYKQTQSRNNKENLFKTVVHNLEKIFLIVSALCLLDS